MKSPEILINDIQYQVYSEWKRPRLDGCIPNLAWFVIDKRNLKAAWRKVAQNRGSCTAGANGRSCIDYAKNAKMNITRLVDNLKFNRYRHGKIIRVSIDKNHSAQQREIGILNVEDRIVHTALKNVLEPVLESSFDQRSFGYRPGRSVPAALQLAIRNLSAKNDDGTARFPFISKLDIADCFPTIPHQRLLDSLKEYIGDGDCMKLISETLNASATSAGVGLLQGSSLSPLLCNFYLNQLDVYLDSLQKNTDFEFIRFADDIIVFGASRFSAWRVLRKAKAQLKTLGLKLRADSGKISKAEKGFKWLGMQFRPRLKTNLFSNQTFEYSVGEVKQNDIYEKIQKLTDIKVWSHSPDVFDLEAWLKLVNEKLKQWYQAYRFAANSRELFESIDTLVKQRIGTVLNAWPNETKPCRKRLPRGFWTWQYAGVQLVCLSAKPPQKPTRLVRKPAWFCKPKGYLS